MVSAARTAPKTKGVDRIRTMILTGDDIGRLADKMEEISDRFDLPFFRRDAGCINASMAVVLIGVVDGPAGLEAACGRCGAPDCTGSTGREAQVRFCGSRSRNRGGLRRIDGCRHARRHAGDVLRGTRCCRDGIYEGTSDEYPRDPDLDLRKEFPFSTGAESGRTCAQLKKRILSSEIPVRRLYDLSNRSRRQRRRLGKTTLTGFLIEYLVSRDKGPILAVDADANSNLNEVLGKQIEATIGQVKEAVNHAELDGEPLPPNMTKAEYLEMQFNQSLVEGEGYDLLVMGRHGEGCYCFVNGLLKTQIAKLAKNYEYLIIDNEAGMENMSRGTLGKVDLLLLISDCSKRGIRTVAEDFATSPRNWI